MEVPSAHFTISERLFVVIVPPTSLNMLSNLSELNMRFKVTL